MDLIERNITKAEGARMSAGLDRHKIEHGDTTQPRQEFSFVAMDGEGWVGIASGLVARTATGYGDWIYLAELFVEKEYRGRGLGAALLSRLEARAASAGIGNVFTWTAGYEAPEFYRKQGYDVFLEKGDYYASGHGRIGLRKALQVTTSASCDRQIETGRVALIGRRATDVELNRMIDGFNEHTESHGNPSGPSERHSFVAMNGDEWVGTSTGLVPKKDVGYADWFGLGELLVEQPHRGHGVGGDLLKRLESKVASLGIGNAWTLAPSYEAGFYTRRGYEVFFEMEKFHHGGYSQIGLNKAL